MCLAIPGQIVETTEIGNSRIAKVRFGDVTRETFLDLLPEARTGDFVMVHTGFAIRRLDAAEAGQTYRLLDEIIYPDPPAPARSAGRQSPS